MRSVAIVTEPQEHHRALHFAVKCTAGEPRVAARSFDREIRDFVAGRTDGARLLHALYDHVLDEKVPERLRAVLKS